MQGYFEHSEDEYARQSRNSCCAHCGSAIGHFSRCPLLNRARAEELSTVKLRFDPVSHTYYQVGNPSELTAQDLAWLKLMNIAGEDTRT
jgi:hypothetical protein